MNFKKKFINWFRYTKLFKELYIKEQCFDYVEEHSGNIAYALIKIHMYYKSNMVETWISEINSSLGSIQEYVHKKCRHTEYITTEDLMEHLWEHYLETPDEIRYRMTSIVSRLDGNHELPINDINHEEIFKSIKITMARVCEDILDCSPINIENYLRIPYLIKSQKCVN